MPCIECGDCLCDPNTGEIGEQIDACECQGCWDRRRVTLAAQDRYWQSGQHYVSVWPSETEFMVTDLRVAHPMTWDVPEARFVYEELGRWLAAHTDNAPALGGDRF